MIILITLLLKRYLTKIAISFSFFVNINKKSQAKRFLLYNFIMDKFFNPNNPVTVILSRIFDLILLNICFVISCIPVVTIGAAMSALYSVTLKMADGEFGYTADTFFSSFRSNLKQATQLWLILFTASLFFSLDLYVVFFILPAKYILFQIPV